MTPPFPYTFYACSCAEHESSIATTDQNGAQEEAEDPTFNPHDPRTAFSLYTLEHLLFCDECNQIRCARCTSDEIISHYCPNCLFDAAPLGVKGDGNRCNRNCYLCPICTSPLTTSVLDTPSDDSILKSENTEQNCILSCQYCAWSSLDLDMHFAKPTAVSRQLKSIFKDKSKAMEDNEENDGILHAGRHRKLEAFYKGQLLDSANASSGLGYGSYSSPANLTRIINLYGGLSHNALKKSQEKPGPMREALPSEGLSTYDIDTTSEDDIIRKMSQLGWDGTTSAAQREALPMSFETRFSQDLWPMAVPTRTRRGKRCRQCRQFVTRPDQRAASAKYRLRIIAVNHIPRLSLRSLSGSHKQVNPSFVLKSEPLQKQPPLQPYVTQQYVLTLRNPIFETVKVTLATSATTPGRVASKVTILCPSFTIGPAGNIWDDALSTPSSTTHGDGSRRAAMASLTGGNEADRQPEAGKVWEQTRNSTSVVLEIVPGALNPPPSIVPDGTKPVELRDGDDILEIPIYVRVEWTAEVAAEGEQKGAPERVPKELAYWCVLGVGRIAN